MLEYDDSAFYYFSMALITCITIPFTYSTLKTIAYGENEIFYQAKNCKSR